MPAMNKIESIDKYFLPTSNMDSRGNLKSQLGIYFWLLQIVIVLGLASIAIWVSLRPKPPTYTIICATNSTFMGQNSSHIFNLQISNPNSGMGIYYNDVNVTLHHGDKIIGVSSVKSFYQGHKKITEREIVIVNEVNQIVKLVRRGAMDLRVHLVTAVQYRILYWKTKHHKMDLEANLPVGSEGKILGAKIKLNCTLTHQN